MNSGVQPRQELRCDDDHDINIFMLLIPDQSRANGRPSGRKPQTISALDYKNNPVLFVEFKDHDDDDDAYQGSCVPPAGSSSSETTDSKNKNCY